MEQGVTFASETDTEVVAQLLEYYYDGADMLDAVGRSPAAASRGPTPWASSAPTAPTSSSPPGRTAP